MLIDNNLSGLNGITFDIGSKLNRQVTGQEIGTFEQAYNNAMSIFEATNQFQSERDKIQMDYVSGRTDDMLGLMMAQQRASDSLNFTVQLTNKAVEAYKEIMRMQI